MDLTDVVISFTSISSAMMHVVITRKPVVIFNFYSNEKDLLTRKKLAIECDSPNSLYDSIIEAISFKPPPERFENFFREFLFKSDGKAAKRICAEILNLF